MRSLKYLLFVFIISFISLKAVSAEVCTYSTTMSVSGSQKTFTYECSITDDLKCGFKDATQVSYKTYKNGTVSNASEENISKLKYQDFLDSDGKVDCNQVKSIKIAMMVGYPQVDVYGIADDSICSTLNEISGAYLYKGCTPFSLKSSSGTGTGSTPTNTEDETEFDANTFCSGPVEGVFTTLGWIFYFLKILIPIILIVFGSIDFGKAMLANKDDEIKKSAKTLVMRIIAGIIIFFIPTLLNFVVDLIGGDDIYNKNNGTFARCTHCMLEPTDDSCRKLVD